MTTSAERDEVVQREWIAVILERVDVMHRKALSRATHPAAVAIPSPRFRTYSLPSCRRAKSTLPGHRVALTLPSLADHALGVEVVTGRTEAGERH
jgi:hypothetical protein